MEHREYLLIEVSRRGRDGDYAGASDVAALKARADALEARPNITSLNAISNVSEAPPADGQVLMYDDGEDEWAPSTPSSGLEFQSSGGIVVESATRLDFISGAFKLIRGSASYGQLDLNYAGTGTSNALARSDHTHTNPAPIRSRFSPGGYMSSGTRNVRTISVTLPAGVHCVVTAKLNMQMRGADPGACYYQHRITINGNARTTDGGSSGFWCVQGVPDKTTWEHDLEITGTGAAITVSADVIYHSGGGFYTDAGELSVTVSTAR